MAFRVAADQSPPLSTVGPFLLAAPLALFAAGTGILFVGPETFMAINTPHTVAVVHALLLGWLTLTIMGTTYQLGAVVFGFALRSVRLARIQFWVHATGLSIFVPATWNWQVHWMSLGGSLVVFSVVLFLANVVRFNRPTGAIQVLYVRISQGFLFSTVLVGLTFVGNHQYGWFAITPGVLAAHAHLGLLGWIGLTLMGVSYQLVPMFNLVRGKNPRFAVTALVLVGGGAVVFAAGMTTDPPRVIRLVLATPLLTGFALYGVDQVRLFAARSRRTLDIQGRAVPPTTMFLALTLVAALGTAWGSPIFGAAQPARWPLTYGVLAAAGWAGTAVIGNSHKIIPFLVWFHRYRPGAGSASGERPLIRDLYSERLVACILALHCIAVGVLAISALSGWLPGLHAGGALLGASGITQFASYAWMMAPRVVHPHQSNPLEAAQ